MQVKEVMTANPITIQADDTVSHAAQVMRKHRIGGLPVMENDKLVGIVTETDLLSLLDTGDISDDLWLPSPLEIIEVPVREIINWEKTKKALSDIGSGLVSEVMSRDLVMIEDEASINEAAKLMLSEGIARLPVIHDDKLAGIVTRKDLVRGMGSE